MINAESFSVFERYKDAGQHAFSNDVVTTADKALYQEIYSGLIGAAQAAISADPYARQFRVWSVRFFQDGGVQGHRPVDLWVCIINQESEILGRYPQVYAIASESGLEIGFAVSIHESDYYNAEVKQRNRNIVPILYGKLPDPQSQFVQNLDTSLRTEPGWQFGVKTRQGSTGSFGSFSELVTYLKSPSSSVRGGGSIYQIITPEEIDADTFDIDQLFSEVLDRFAPLMRLLLPTPEESVIIESQKSVDEIAREIPEFDPTGISDGRKKALRSVAIRQGQAKFREKLLDAYGSKCAITGGGVTSTLQAAHIFPYRGTQTNTVQNGILLRADVHNLFDLGQIQIDANTLKITVSDDLLKTPYAKLHGRKIRIPEQASQRPSTAALSDRLKFFKVLED
jgi:hypothetical protein